MRITKQLAFFILFFSMGSSVFADPSIFGNETTEARGLRNTKAIIIAKLLKRVEGDIAYVVFEKIRVIRGKEDRDLLIFPHPHASIRIGCSHIFNEIQTSDLKQLRLGKLFILSIGNSESPDNLTRWQVLPEKDQRDMMSQEIVINSELKRYKHYDNIMKMDPLKAMFGKDIFGEDMFPLCCYTDYYSSDASEKEVQNLLKGYSRIKSNLWPSSWLVSHALSLASKKNYKIPDETLLAIYNMEISRLKNADEDLRDSVLYWLGKSTDAKYEKIILEALKSKDPKLRNAGLFALSHRDDRKYDSIFIEALKSKDNRCRSVALNILSHRKTPGSLPEIEKVMRQGANHDKATIAILCQRGMDNVEGILKFCLEKGEKGPNKEIELDRFFKYLKKYVGKKNIKTLRSLDDPKSIGVHTKVTDLRLLAGDILARKEYFNIHKVEYSGLKRIPENTLEQAKLSLSKGYSIEYNAKILFRSKDPELGDRLVPFVYKQATWRYASKYLALSAREKHRPILNKQLKHKYALMRSYAWAGLANLGDRDAMVKVAEILGIGHSWVPYYLGEILPMRNMKEYIKAWEDQVPKKSNRIESLVNAYIAERLKQIQIKLALKEKRLKDKKPMRNAKKQPTLREFEQWQMEYAH